MRPGELRLDVLQARLASRFVVERADGDEGLCDRDPRLADQRFPDDQGGLVAELFQGARVTLER